MRIMGIFKKDYIIGLDIGSSSIKLVQFARRADGLYLINASLEEIPRAKDRPPSEDKSPNEEEILPPLARLLKKVSVKDSRVIVGINCPRTAVRRITAPYMPMEELGECIKLDAKSYFHFPVDKSVLGFEIIGVVEDKDVKKYEVLVAVSPEDTVGKYLSILDRAGVKAASLIPVSYALQRLVAATSSREEELKCFVDIGITHTELVISRGKNFAFSRNIPVAGGDFTKAMTMILASERGTTKLSLEEAEKIKREVGIPAEGEIRLVDDKISTTQILSMLRMPLEHLVNEIERCLDYYREENAGARINSIALSGRGAFLKVLSNFLSQELGVEVKFANPLAGLNVEEGVEDYIDKIGHPSQFAVAIGLALSGGGGINLLPSEIKKTKRTFKRAAAQVLAVLAVLIAAFIYIGMSIQLTNFNMKASVAKMELASLRSQLKEFDAQRFVSEVLRDEPYWEDLFRELSNIVPASIVLTELGFQDKIISIKGIITSTETERLLTNFILTLEKGIFKNVKLIQTKELKGKIASEFELTCRVD